MSGVYNYQEFRERLFTEQGQKEVLDALRHAEKLCEESGAVKKGKVWLSRGFSWQEMAVVDRLVEMGEFVVVGHHGPNSWLDQVMVPTRQR